MASSRVKSAMGDVARPVAQVHHYDGAIVAVSPERDPGTIERIQSFDVSTDSVVATATVVVTAATRRIEIDWGDGAIDVIRQRPGIISPDPAPPGSDPLPRGTYEVEHVYDVSDDGRAFEQVVYVRTDDSDGRIDIRQRRITMTPRYRIVHYPMSVRLGEACDPGFVSGVLIKVMQSIDGQVVNRWNWEASNNFFGASQRFLLEGSGASLESEVPALGQVLESKRLVFDFTEQDDFSPDDRNRIVIYVSLGPTAPEGDVSERIEQISRGGCEIIYSYGREVTLLKPRKQANPGVFAPN